MSHFSIMLAIADGDLMAARLLSDRFRHFSDFTVVSCTADKASLLGSVRRDKPQVAIIGTDLQDGRLSGLGALQEACEADGNLRAILLFDNPDPQLVVEALRAGARGIFSRGKFDFKLLRKCIRRVLEGQLWLGNAELQFVVDALIQSRPLRVVNSDGLNLLSRREEEVMRLVAEGFGNREIAQQMNLSENTVKNYIFHIFDKLGISNRVELVLYALTSPKVEARLPAQQERPPSNVARSAEDPPNVRSEPN